MGSRLRRTSIGFWSARLPTVSEIFATRALRSSALARIAVSTAGQNFSWSGVSCNAAFARSIRRSISVFRSAAFSRSGVAGEGVCARAIGDAVRKSAVAPTTIIFIIGDLLGKVIPQALSKKMPRTAGLVDSNQRNQRCLYGGYADGFHKHGTDKKTPASVGRAGIMSVALAGLISKPSS